MAEATRNAGPAIVLSLLLALLATAAVATPPEAAGPALDLHALPPRFVDLDGRPVRLADFRGRPAIVAMDHTQSLVICSDTIRRMRAVRTAAERLGLAFDYIVLSLDPEADTPEAWRRYQRYFEVGGPGWHFLVASPADTALLVERLGIRMSFEQGYRFHEVKLFRIDGKGRVLRTLEGYDRDTEAFLR